MIPADSECGPDCPCLEGEPIEERVPPTAEEIEHDAYWSARQERQEEEERGAYR